MHGLTAFANFIHTSDGRSNDWILGWDGFADKFHYWTWHDDEFGPLLPTIMSDVLTNPMFPCYSKKPDGSRSYNPAFDIRYLDAYLSLAPRLPSSSSAHVPASCRCSLLKQWPIFTATTPFKRVSSTVQLHIYILDKKHIF
jgi:hypothetical protein